MNIFVPLALVTLIGSIAIVMLLAGIPGVLRHRLLLIVCAAFAIRLALATSFEIFPQTRIFHDDAVGYENMAIGLARYWKGTGPPLVHSSLTVYDYGYGYISLGGVLCYVFGDFRLHLSAWNSLFGTLSVILVYRLVALFFHPAVALRTAMLAAFMPSMILWSAVAIKDPVMILLIATALYLYARLRQQWSFVLALLLSGTIIGMYFIRFYISYYIGLSILATVLIGRSSEGFRTRRNLLVLLVLVAVIAASGLGSTLTAGLEAANLERAATFRIGMAATANSGFARDLDVSSVRGLLSVLPLGLAVLFFGPFPWQMRGTLPLMTLPEMLFWWSLVPALWRGLRFAIGHAFTRVSPIIVFCISLSISYSITLGNVGAAVRQRAQIFLFLFIFVALGKYLSYCRKRRIDPRILLSPSGGR